MKVQKLAPDPCSLVIPTNHLTFSCIRENARNLGIHPNIELLLCSRTQHPPIAQMACSRRTHLGSGKGWNKAWNCARDPKEDHKFGRSFVEVNSVREG